MAKKEMSETQMTNAICKYLQLKYPKVEYRTDKDGNNASKTALWAKSAQKGKKGFPDLIIKQKNRKYNGLVIELKKEGVRVFKKDGSLRSDPHLQEQQEWLDWFSTLGCVATFAIGFDDAIQAIDCYLEQDTYETYRKLDIAR